MSYRTLDPDEPLPPVDPTRSHREILEDALSLLEEHAPLNEEYRGGHPTGLFRCSSCGFPYFPYDSMHGVPHHTYKDSFTNYGDHPCKWLRAIAELRAWTAVEWDKEQHEAQG